MTPNRSLVASIVTFVAASAALVLSFRPGSDSQSAETLRLAAADLQSRLVAMEAQPKKGPWIHAEEPVFDWGTIEEGAEVRHTFHLTNKGTETVTIEKARTNCGCGAFDFTREIPTGGEGQLTVLIPGNKTVPGKLRASITLRTNARGDDVLVVTGCVTPRVAAAR